MRVVVLAFLTLTTLATGAGAQEPYPSRPVSIINPFPPGGIADLAARPLATAIERLLKQPFVVVNRPGASGAVGAPFAVRGQTGRLHRPHHADHHLDHPGGGQPPRAPARVHARSVLGHRADRHRSPVLAVSGTLEDLKEIVEDARKRPGEIAFASSGPYGASHVPFEMFLPATGVKMRHLPTPAGGPRPRRCWAATRICGPRRPRCPRRSKAGKMGARRLRRNAPPAFPDVPTLKESATTWSTTSGRASSRRRGIPPHVFQTLRDATRRTVQDDEFKAAMDKAKTPIAYQDSDEFKAFWDADAKRIAAAIQFIGKIEAK